MKQLKLEEYNIEEEEQREKEADMLVEILIETFGAEYFELWLGDKSGGLFN